MEFNKKIVEVKIIKHNVIFLRETVTRFIIISEFPNLLRNNFFLLKVNFYLQYEGSISIGSPVNSIRKSKNEISIFSLLAISNTNQKIS